MNDFSFPTDKAYIVTGATSGIGLATAHLLKTHGVKLALWDRSADALQKVASKLDAQAVVVDVTQPDSVAAAMGQSIEYLGKLDGLIHAAGILNAGLFEQKSIDSHRSVVVVNLFGTVNMAYAALPHLRQSHGSLVMMASSSAFYGAPEYAVYGATKAAILSFAQSLRLELEGTGVHIGVVSPLFVSSPMIDGYNGNTHLIRSHSPFFDTRSLEAFALVILDGIARRLPWLATSLTFLDESLPELSHAPAHTHDL